MNYRHVYHAGNFADVIKHLLLVLCLDRLSHKESGFFVLDAHAGAGMYDLKGTEAQKTLEYRGGIERLKSLTDMPADLALYCNLWLEDYTQGRYPGSPILASRMLRPQDRMIANELHPADAASLGAALRDFPLAQVTQMDAYQAMRAHLPPRERRGLVLIDPPFEIEQNEFGLLTRALDDWHKRWREGTYIIWYPIKPKQPAGPFLEAVAQGPFKEVWHCRMRMQSMPGASARAALLETGLCVINPPYQVPERLRALAPLLEKALGAQLSF